MGSPSESSSQSSPERLNRTGSKAIPAFVIFSTGIFAFLSARATLTTGIFTSDDLGFSWQARTIPLVRLLLTPMDVHVVPLHRLASFALSNVAPMSTGVALTVTLVMHVATLCLLYAALRALAPSRANALVVAWYGTFVHLPSLLAWWTAALHRLPYLVCLAVATIGFVKFRKSREIAAGAWVVGSTVLACGFFEKGMLIPLILAGLEASLAAHDRTAPSRRSLLLLAASAGAAAAWFLFWRHGISAAVRGVNTDPHFLWEYLRLSWAMLLRALVGAEWGSVAPGAIMLGGLAFATILLSRPNAVVWAAAALVVSLVLIVTGLSRARVALFGIFPAVSPFYYPDAMFVLSLFAGTAVGRAAVSPRPVRMQDGARLAALLAALVLTATIAVRATVNGTRRVSDSPTIALTRYFENVRNGVRELQKKGAPLVFVDGRVPSYVEPFAQESATHHATLIGLGVSPRFVKKPGVGVYRIAVDGTVTPSWLR